MEERPITSPGEEETTQWLTFVVAKETYGMPVMAVKEVLRYTKIVPVPGAPHVVSGVINLRGTIVSVVEARKLFGLPDIELDSDARIIIIEQASGTLGLMVDRVDSVQYIKQKEIESAPNVGTEINKNAITGVYHHEDYLFILLNTDELLKPSDYALEEVSEEIL